MEPLAVEMRAVRILAEALAIGLLVGVERYKSRGPGETGFAGVRTFSLAALLGATTGLVNEPLLTFASFLALASVTSIGYLRSSRQNIGATTEFATFLVFWLGYLLHTREILAISAAIVVTILLASKRALHDFVREDISEIEFYDTLKFLAVVIVVWPLLPAEPIGPLESLNPSRFWLLVVLVSSISFFGYVVMRFLGDRRGLALTAIVGGIVSTTAAVVALADIARTDPSRARAMGVAGVLANIVQMPRLLILVAVLQAPVALALAGPFLAMTGAGLLGAWLLGARLPGTQRTDVRIALRNPFSLIAALKFAGLFVIILLIVEIAQARLGEAGVLAAAIAGGAGSVSASALAVAQLSARGQLTIDAASLAIFAAWVANAIVKWCIALFYGRRPFALWLGGGLLTMLVTGVVVLGLTGLGRG